MGKIENQSGCKRSESSAAVIRSAARNVVEVLEARQLMSVSWSNGNLTVNGTSNADTIVVDTMPFVSGMCLVSVTENNVLSQPWTPMLLSKKLTVNGKGGGDNIQCQKVEEMAVTVDGGTGNDTIQGGSKNDTLKGGDNDDTIYGRDGNDTIDGGTNNDTLIGGWGADKFIGGAGTDTVDYGNRNDNLILTINGAADDGVLLEGDNIGLDVENLIGGDGNDLLIGDADANKLQGGDGSDEIYGNGGADTIYGGTDADVFTPGAVHNDHDVIHGGDGADFLYAPVNGSAEIHGDKNDDFIYGAFGNDALHGDAGDDTIDGGAGNDQLWGGAGDDTLQGGAGDDTLVTIGGGLNDELYGNGGFDTFWLDDENPGIERVYDDTDDEDLASHLHWVKQFQDLNVNPFPQFNIPPVIHSTVGKELNGEDLVDPVAPAGAKKWADFSDHPLFPDVGPVAGDVRQGMVGDCYLGVAISGIDRSNPDLIRQHVVDLGDGTYAVTFQRYDENLTYRVDGELPVDDNGRPVSMNTGIGNSIYTAIIEKAWAFARADQGTYASLDGGTVDEAYYALGCSNAATKESSGFYSKQDLMKWVADRRAADAPVSIGTWDSFNGHGDAGPVYNDHGYDVVSVNKGANGQYVSVTLRNPWGYDGKNDGSNPNDGYITVTKDQFCNAVETLWTADA